MQLRPKRKLVLLDVAKGIEFLYCSCDPPIVHYDIKPSNVLLDRDFSTKIADFGLAKVLGMDESEIVKSFIECGEEERDLETETVDDADASPSEYLERTSVSDQISVDSSNRRFLGRKKSGG
nr:receptor-like serine/threonine-protein kinase At2g45590 [Tanacetum cinerariifolium]